MWNPFRRKPKGMRFPNGIPRVDEFNRNVIAFRITDPIYNVGPDGSRSLLLPDGSSITYSKTPSTDVSPSCRRELSCFTEAGFGSDGLERN